MVDVDVWVCAGQSNMAGRGSSAQSPATDPDRAWGWTPAGGIQTLADPFGDSPYNSNTGSMLPAFANVFTAASGRPSLFVPCAVGGTALLEANSASNGDWSPTGTRFSDSVDRTQGAIADLIAQGDTVAGVNVLFHQGERDAQGEQNLNAYTNAYVNLVSRYRSALGYSSLKVYALRIGLGDPDTSGWQKVRNSQDAAASGNNGVVMAYTRAVEFFALGWMKADGLHYTQAGLNDMGAAAGRVVASDQGFEPPPPPPAPAVRRSRIARHLWMTSEPREAQ